MNKVYLEYLFDELRVEFFAIEEVLSPRMCCKVWVRLIPIFCLLISVREITHSVNTQLLTWLNAISISLKLSKNALCTWSCPCMRIRTSNSNFCAFTDLEHYNLQDDFWLWSPFHNRTPERLKKKLHSKESHFKFSSALFRKLERGGAGLMFDDFPGKHILTVYP